jgi:hypothetical protein
MKIAKKRKILSKKIIITSILILLLIAGSTLLFLYIKTNVFSNHPVNNTPQNINTVNYNPTTNEQTENGSNIKASSGSADKPPDPTSVEGSTKKQVELIIINASKTKINVQINAVVKSGTCTLTLTSPNQTTITLTSDVQALASVSACKTFNYTELAAGTWAINVSYDSDTLTGNVISTRSL